MTAEKPFSLANDDPFDNTLGLLRRFLPPGGLHAVAVVGRDSARFEAALRSHGYRRVRAWPAPEDLYHLYQPGRLFDAIVLAGCLELLSDRPRALDQLQASLADPGYVIIFDEPSSYDYKALDAAINPYGLHYTSGYFNKSIYAFCRTEEREKRPDAATPYKPLGG